MIGRMRSHWNRLASFVPPTVGRLLSILVIVLLLYGAVLASDPNASSAENHLRLAQRIGFYGVLTLGAGTLIISGGIDLSMGSVVGLSAIAWAILVKEKNVPGLPAIGLVLLGTALIGLLHGLLVTKLRLQPFVVTLCGLFIYRGLALWIALPDPRVPVVRLLEFLSFGLYVSDAPLQSGSAMHKNIAGMPELAGINEWLYSGTLWGIPAVFLLLLVLGAALTVFLHFSVYGRYLYAIGYNEQAARYAGIPTDRYKILAYVICSTLCGLAGVLHMLRLEGDSPSSAGLLLELYAITGAVLGGCSLRGGQGTVAGMLLGTAVLPLLRNFVNFSRIQDDLEYFIIGVALLVGIVIDELLKRRGARRA
jgi:ribose transport system permease protein